MYIINNVKPLKNQIMIHWKTSLMGLLVGGLMIVEGVLSKNNVRIGEGVGIVIAGFAAADAGTPNIPAL